MCMVKVDIGLFVSSGTNIGSLWGICKLWGRKIVQMANLDIYSVMF